MTTFDRRRLLQGALGAGIGAVTAAAVQPAGATGRAGGDPHNSATGSSARGHAPSARAAPRLLVVVEMLGGNDGLSMVVPYADPHYAAVRPRTAVAATSVLPIDATLGFNPHCPNIHAAAPAVVTNVGTFQPDLSHFEMQRRWWTADPDGTLEPTTGWLGRLCDAVGSTSDVAVGVTVGPAPSTSMIASKVVTLSVDPQQAPGFPAPTVKGAVGATLRAMWLTAEQALAGSHPSTPGAFGSAQTGLAEALRFGAKEPQALPPAGVAYPAGTTGTQFALAARLLDTDLGIRVVHVPLTDDFDTHEGMPGRYPALMEDLDGSLGTFRTDLAQRGLADRVLIMTTSEFGRRVADNASQGTDHGTASTHLLFGPVTAGVHGDPPNLTKLDTAGNLVAQVTFTQYYALAVEGWMGVPSGEVLHGAPKPLAGVLAGAATVRSSG